ncbi:hypothetical protein ACP70R_042469 [Stipagrostis hirtigluma subsp. patula]
MTIGLRAYIFQSSTIGHHSAVVPLHSTFPDLRSILASASRWRPSRTRPPSPSPSPSATPTSSAPSSTPWTRPPTRKPVLDTLVAVLLAVPVLTAYLLVVTLAFAIRVAADGYAHVVACGGAGDDTLAQAAALSPAAVLGWFANVVVKLIVLAVAFLVFSGLAVALFQFATVP